TTTRRPPGAGSTGWSSPCTPRWTTSADMGRSFEMPQEAEVPATPEEVWEAISTGPGIDSWYLGRTQIDDGYGRSAAPRWAGRWTGCRRPTASSTIAAT